MKIFGLIAVLALTASCGDKGSSKNKENRFLDPQSVDKMEQAIRSQRAGMVQVSKETGTSYYADIVDGKVVTKTENINSTSRETILKIDGDSIYVLEERFENGEVTPNSRSVSKDSLDKLVRELSKPLPEGASVSVNNNTLTVKIKFSYSDDYSSEGRSILTNILINGLYTTNLDNPRCTGLSSSTSSSTVTVDGVSSNLPVSSSRSVDSCERELSSTELKALDLKDLALCDESKETDGDEPSCEPLADLSYLVN